MHQHAFNLLQYPNQARQQKTFHHVWTTCAGLWVGCCLALALQIWQAAQTAQMQQEHAQLKSLLQARAQQAQAQASAQSHRQLLAEQFRYTQSIARHQQDWVVLHATLQNQAQLQGLRLTRWTAQDGQIQWHGHMDRFETMSAARQLVAQQLEQPVLLVSTNSGFGPGVDFVWQTPWPSVQTPTSTPTPNSEAVASSAGSSGRSAAPANRSTQTMP